MKCIINYNKQSSAISGATRVTRSNKPNVGTRSMFVWDTLPTAPQYTTGNCWRIALFSIPKKESICRCWSFVLRVSIMSYSSHTVP